MTYTTITDVRAMSNLSSSEITDEDITYLLNKSIAEVNLKLNVKVIREPIEYLDPVRENDIDGVNDTYYIKNWKGKYFADMNNDGEITTEDIIVYSVDNDNVETQLTVSSITHDEGKFVLSTAPLDSQDLYITYMYSSFDESGPDTLVNLASTYLTISYAYLKVNSGASASVRFGNTRISRKISEAYGSYYDRYQMILKEINARSTGSGYFIDSKVRI